MEILTSDHSAGRHFGPINILSCCCKETPSPGASLPCCSSQSFLHTELSRLCRFLLTEILFLCLVFSWLQEELLEFGSPSRSVYGSSTVLYFIVSDAASGPEVFVASSPPQISSVMSGPEVLTLHQTSHSSISHCISCLKCSYRELAMHEENAEV